MKQLFVLFSIVWVVFCSAPGPNAIAQEKFRDAADRARVVVMRPIVLCDDKGENPAAFRLPKRMVDQVYTRADLEFLYLPVRYWSYQEGRQGKVNLDRIVTRGLDAGMICPDPRVVTLLFVSGIDGQNTPAGRGLQNGNICFVCLGPDPEKNEAAMESFVVAHEVGHCLNLIHTVDDPDVPDDVPNLQGDGPFEERLAITGLHPTQCDTVLKSPLVNDRYRFLSRTESARRLVDETWEPYLSISHDDMFRFTLGLDADHPIPSNPENRRKFADARYAEFAAEFTDAEEGTIREQIAELTRFTGDDWPLVARFPWNFIKVNDGFCNDFPHTRGLSIVLGSRVLQRMKEDPVFGMTILLHEKLHVLQRVCDGAFDNLYRDYGYQKIDLAEASVAGLKLARNPDALSSYWAIPVDRQPHFLATVIGNSGGRLAFEENLFPLKPRDDGSFVTGSADGSKKC